MPPFPASRWLLALGLGISAGAPGRLPATEPPPAWRCLSAVAWQREQEFQKPANEEQAFRNGPFDLPQIVGSPQAGAFLPWAGSSTSSVVAGRLAEGLRYLHALDDESAERCFRDAARLDPQCAGAWLGLTVANEKLPSRAMYFLDKAAAVAAPGSSETSWAGAYREFFQSITSQDLPDRLNALATRLESLNKGRDNQPGAAAMALRYRILASYVSGLPLPDAAGRDAVLQSWTGQPGGDLLLPYTVLLWSKTDPARAAERTQALVKRWPQPAMQRLAADPLLAQGRLDRAVSLLQTAVLQADPEFGPMVLASQTQSQQRFDQAATLAWSLYHLGSLPEAQSVATRLLQQPRKPAFTGLEAVDDAPDGIFLEAVRLRAQLLMAAGDWPALTTWMQETTSQADSLLLKLHGQYFDMISASAQGQKESVMRERAALRQSADLISTTPYLNRHAPLATRMVRGADAFADLCQGRVSPFLKDVVDVPPGVIAPKLAAAGVKDGAAAMLEEALRKQPGSIPLQNALARLRDTAAPVAPAPPQNAIHPDAASPSPVVLPSPQAPALALPDKTGKLHELTSYRGQPVLVIFFLGGGCPHCVEQLQKFSPRVKAFNQAGISLLTVSTDRVDELAVTLGPNPAIDPELPFLILADPGLTAFKAWRCHDDFLNKPMHGTFLLDGEGRVLWSDISHDPYVQADFLLGECRRLLKNPDKVPTSP